MVSRAGVLKGLVSVRRHLYTALLALGMIGLSGLLFSDLRLIMSGGAVPALAQKSGELVPVTQGASMDGFGAWSPNGKRIAFMRDGQIMLTDPAGRRVKPLTSQPQHWDAAPTWKPDGTAIAFVRTAIEGNQSKIMVVQPDTAEPPQAVVTEPAQIGYVAWSPDGGSLYYSTKDRIVRVSAKGGIPVVLLSLPETWEALSGGLAVSPDGKQLIFGAGPRTERGVNYELWQMGSAGGKPEQLTRTGGIMPAFDPTGQRVAYRNPRQESGIYLLNLATQNQTLLLPDEPKAMYFHPAFSPNGKQLLVSRLLLEAPPASNHGFISHIYLMKLP